MPSVHQGIRTMNQRTRLGLFVLIILLIAAVVTRVMPAVQSPDENVHLLRADMISHGQWLLQPDAQRLKGREGGWVDANLDSFLAAMMPRSGHPPAKVVMERAKDINWAGHQVFTNSAGTGYYTPLVYIPHAVGLFISRQLDLSMRTSYELTRAIVIATSFAITIWACLLHTPSPLALMLLLTPMSIFQFLSPTIDGLCASITLLLISIWIILNKEPPGKNISRLEYLLYLLIFILCSARTNLLPALLIPALILKNNYSSQRLFAVLTLYTLTLGWIAFGVFSTYDHRVVRSLPTTEIMIRYLSSPSEFFTLLQDTVLDNDFRRFYKHSFIGILGWADTPVSRQSIRIIFSALILVALIQAFRTPWRSALEMRGLMLFIFFSSVLLIFFAMAVSWSSYPALRIIGVHGRYFTIPAIFLAYAFENLNSEKSALKPWVTFMLLCFAGYSLYAMTRAVIIQHEMPFF